MLAVPTEVKSWLTKLKDTITLFVAMFALLSLLGTGTVYLLEDKVTAGIREASGYSQLTKSVEILNQSVTDNSKAIKTLSETLISATTEPVVIFNLVGSSIKDTHAGEQTEVTWSYELKRTNCTSPEVYGVFKDSRGFTHVINLKVSYKSNVPAGTARYYVPVPKSVATGVTQFYVTLEHRCPDSIGPITSVSPSLQFEVFPPLPEPRYDPN